MPAPCLPADNNGGVGGLSLARVVSIPQKILKMTQKNRAILDALVGMSNGATRAELDRKLGLGGGYNRALKDYLERGFVTRSGSRGTYRFTITDAGRYHLSDSAASKPADKTHCEIWTGARWEIWPVLAAYEVKHIATVRCYECHGPIVLMKPSNGGRNRAHFEHRPAHDGCPLVYRGRLIIAKNSPIPVTAQPTSDGSFLNYLPDSVVDEMIDDATACGVDGSQNEAGSSNSTPSVTERAQLRLARVGQGKFRDALKKRWTTCSVLGCGPIDVLVASHIHAWRLCETNRARLSVDNGLLLSPNLDKLFDRGFISFAPDGMLLVARHLSESDMTALGLHRGMRLRAVYAGMKPFLKRHRANGSWIYFSHETCDFNEAQWPG